MQSVCFDLIKERKRVKQWDWDRLAEEVNKENGTNVNGDQIREFVQRGVVPFGGWLVDALEYQLGIQRRHPKTKISFKGGGGDND